MQTCHRKEKKQLKECRKERHRLKRSKEAVEIRDERGQKAKTPRKMTETGK